MCSVLKRQATTKRIEGNRLFTDLPFSFGLLRRRVDGSNWGAHNMTFNCNLTDADSRAFRRYVLFKYRKMHWFVAVTLALCLAYDWFSYAPETPISEKLAGLIGLTVLWFIIVLVLSIAWKIISRFTGGRFRGSTGPHVFEIGEDTFVESNSEGRSEVKIAGLRRIAETDSYFFVIGNTGRGFIIPKRDLQSYDVLRGLQKRIATLGA
jgi:hypothetical protein